MDIYLEALRFRSKKAKIIVNIRANAAIPAKTSMEKENAGSGVGSGENVGGGVVVGVGEGLVSTVPTPIAERGMIEEGKPNSVRIDCAPAPFQSSSP